jgi:hypothetical protein
MLNSLLNGCIVLVLGSNVDFHARMGDPREMAPDRVDSERFQEACKRAQSNFARVLVLLVAGVPELRT